VDAVICVCSVQEADGWYKCEIRLSFPHCSRYAPSPPPSVCRFLDPSSSQPAMPQSHAHTLFCSRFRPFTACSRVPRPISAASSAMQRPSRHCGFIGDPGCGDASPGPVQTRCQSRGPAVDLAVGSPLHTIHAFGLDIGRSFQTTSQQIQSFIAFMSQQSQTAAWFAEASRMLSQGLRDSCQGKTIEHQANLERAVWDVIKNPGWIFFEKHPSRNKRRNETALKEAAAKDLTDSAIKTWEEI